MMDTPICDFVSAYESSAPLRLHMPGHKGMKVLGPEGRDITEVDGADVLYSAKGIIRKSEENAAKLFGTGLTLYSAEGSSLSIRAMLCLIALYARESGRRPLILAGRNAHKVFITGAALVDIDVKWLFSKESGSVVCCALDLALVEEMLRCEKPAAVYVTSPDYLGNVTDIRALSELCHRYGALLAVDNAHGAYTHFLPHSMHPMDLGADMCSDSAHKTLPVLTGGAYLHISKTAPALLRDHAENALALFASTSPSYLILQSLDAANRYLADGYSEKLASMAERLSLLRTELAGFGYQVVSGEPMKLTLGTKAIGWRGDALADHLQTSGVVCEFADPDFAVMMFTPEIAPEALETLRSLLLSVEKRAPIVQKPPVLSLPKVRMRPREALFSLQESIPVSQASGRVLAAASVTCPPAVPVVACGEEIDESAVACFQYYGIERCFVVKEK